MDLDKVSSWLWELELNQAALSQLCEHPKNSNIVCFSKLILSIMWRDKKKMMTKKKNKPHKT